MSPFVFLDPAIDLSSQNIVSIIIEFKTKPAKVAVLEAKAKGISLSLEEAKERVEESHAAFQKELQVLLAQNNVPFFVKHKYKQSLNGVSMDLPAIEIKRLVTYSNVISKIHLNKKFYLDPPITPHDGMY
ncbi:protease inhibitor I9 family protein [Peribacillus alkalitolerans]|uniref:protease inhibitor I9 family protein n=1 Tax=Peribacillus alkalitolerans TaxID=1550385 RepID=UPI0013D18714|nr:protease inhibitor I9 family protein [Peribacillus alkalitolerans]